MLSRWPVSLPGDPVITSPFGWRINPVTKDRRFHGGLDISVPQGTPIVSPSVGRVVSVLSDATCGQGLIVEHSPSSRTGYCHLSKTLVRKGEQVRAGDPIGLSGGRPGTTGAGRSTGPHLHFIVYTKVGGKWEKVDPVAHLPRDGTAAPMAGDEDESGWSVFARPFREFSEWMWGSPDAEPSEDSDGGHAHEEPAPVAARRSSPATSSFTFDGIEGGLVGREGAVQAGRIPAGTYDIVVNIGGTWSTVRSDFSVQAGKAYRATRSGGSLQIFAQ